MKKKISFLMAIILLVFAFTACENSKEISEENAVSYRFKQLYKMGPSGSLDSENIDKMIIQYMDASGTSHSVCIDMTNKALYNEISALSADSSQPTESLTDEKLASINDIYTDYIAGWNEDYSTNENFEDGVSWVVVVADTTGDIEIKGGSGSEISKCVPDNFNDFVDALSQITSE